jgi:glycosyltransferase involved in cell wall biosynthesis
MTPKRITIVASELLGRPGTGGAGTADSLLAVALARHGHEVELVVASGREIGALSSDWTRIYESSGVDIRLLEQLSGVRPSYLAPTLEVFNALRERPPDLAIVNDWRGLGYAAMTTRQLGRGLADTAFIVHCHGPARVLAAFAQKVPDTLARFGEEIAERSSIQLADAVVSPSAWLLGWLREHGWPVPDSASVIPIIRQSAALDETPARADNGTRISRLAFFGHLREGKGIRIFLDALHALEPDLRNNTEVLFLGSESKRWSAERIRNAVPAQVDARIETQLDREAALAELRKPGTLAVMPSLLDNSPNTVGECIESGIPFVATETGGIPELIADADRARVLCRPTSEDLTAALHNALTSGAFEPANPAHDPRESLKAWLALVEDVAPAAPARARAARRVAVVARSDKSGRRARQLAGRTTSVEVDVAVDRSRRAGLARTAAEWVLFLDDDDEPQDGLIDALVAAQAASDADAVTTGVQPVDDAHGVQLFLGDCGALGLVQNLYGVIGLARASLVVAELQDADGADPDWPLFARLALGGARIVSIPEALSVHRGKPGSVTDVPGDGLTVLEAFEDARITAPPGLAQLAATLAAALEKTPTMAVSSSVNRRTLARRAAGRLRRTISRRTRP